MKHGDNKPRYKNSKKKIKNNHLKKGGKLCRMLHGKYKVYTNNICQCTENYGEREPFQTTLTGL